MDRAWYWQFWGFVYELDKIVGAILFTQLLTIVS
jgi:hypothetical protein